MNPQEEISVIVNCYNSDTYLKEAIDSIINQTYEKWEIIFWDNQSTDKSAEIIKSYTDERIKYFYAPMHTSLGIARNLAVKKTNNQWIAFLDSDDVWDKDKLKFSVDAINKNKNLGLVYNKSIVMDKNNDILSTIDAVVSGYIHEQLLIKGNFIVQSSMLINREAFYKVKGINEILKFCPDYDLSLKITQKYEVVAINKYLTYYRMHSNNITSTKIYENNMEVIKLLEEYTKNKNLAFNIKYNILVNNSYRIGTLIVKLFFKKEFKNILIVLKQYFYYIIFFPIAIIKVKFFR